MSSYLAHKRKGFQGAAPAAFDGFGNRSRDFDGSSDYITVQDGSWIPTGAQTWMCWLKAETLLNAAVFNHNVGTGNQRSIGITAFADTSLQAFINPSGETADAVAATSSTGVYSTGTWVHVALVFTPSTSIELFIDGVSAAVNNVAVPAAVHDSTADVGIGANGLGQAPFQGNICDCRIYDTDLTASQISDIYNGTNITTNLVGHWLTDADDTEDKAGSNNGTNYGSKYSYDNPSPPVEFGSASRGFDGVDDYISIADNADIPTGAQTICCWVKFNTLNSGASGQDLITHWTTVDSNNASFAIYMPNASNGKVRFYVSADGQLHENVEASDAISALEWSHVACVLTPNDSIKIYINGSLSNTLATTGISSMYNSSVDLVLGGRDQVSVTTLLNGNLADCRIYDTELTASQISDLYNGTNITTNLVGHWLTNNDDVEDKAGTNDGTNFGSLYDYDAPFTEVTLPNHFWNLSDTGTYADSGKLASAGWDLSEYSSVSSSVQSIGTSTKTVLDTTSGGVLEYKNGANVDVGWDSESKEISMACWFYCDSITNSGNWLISWRGTGTSNKIAQIFVLNDGTGQIFRGSVWDGQGDTALTPQAGTSIALNTWYHGAMTWDNTTLKTYVNGEFFGSAANASVDGFTTNTVGCEFALSDGSWGKGGTSLNHTGYTFGAGIWDVALTENQIKALYNDGNALDYSETTWR